MKGLPSIEALENSHQFPGHYVFKVFGAHEQSFVDATRKIVLDSAGEKGLLNISSRASSGGKHICVTLEVLVHSAQQVQALYMDFTRVDSVRYIL